MSTKLKRHTIVPILQNKDRNLVGRSIEPEKEIEENREKISEKNGKNDISKKDKLSPKQKKFLEDLIKQGKLPDQDVSDLTWKQADQKIKQALLK